MPVGGHGGFDFDSGGTSSSSYTDEQAMDAVGGALRSTSTVVAIYNDAADTISFAALTAGSTDTIIKPYVTTLTATTTSVFTVRTGAQTIIVEVVGGGGGGGGSAGSSTQAAGAVSGGSGGYAFKVYTSTATAYSYRVGPGGTGGNAGANPGNAGGTSTFENIIVNGGGAGDAGTLGTAITFFRGAAGGAAGTGGDLNLAGNPAEKSERGSATAAASGNGGPSIYGGAGRGNEDDFAGNAGGAPGAGGSGAVVSSINVARAGGNGADGIIVVQEYVRE